MVVGQSLRVARIGIVNRFGGSHSDDSCDGVAAVQRAPDGPATLVGVTATLTLLGALAAYGPARAARRGSTQ